MLRNLILGTLAFCSPSIHAQINGYAQVTSISGSTCTIGAYNESAATFAVGKQVVIMQMQDDVIGENIFNDASFGNLGAIQKAGAFSVREIVAVERVGGVPISITLDLAPVPAFNFGPNSSVQLITYELLGNGGDFTTTSNIGAISWNGTIGGVIALRVNGILHLEHNIHADGNGLRGGARTSSAEGPCAPGEYIHDSTSPTANFYAAKGEGIYKHAGTAWLRGRARSLNGGGGGNANNGGGGGGSNLTAGGTGGAGFGCATDASGGLGGVDLSGQTSSSRLFMGGGGGGGEGDGNSSSVGMRGGGIILIKADMIRTSGSCGGRTISASGSNANASGSDGAGGGGGGGSILMHVTNYDISSGCPLTIRANGGNGGSVNNAVDHGGGGGGGQGALFFKGMVPISNVIAQTNNGVGGCNNNSSPCNSQAGNGAGSDGMGIFYYDLTPLPVELLAFSALPQNGMVDLLWSTATERDNDRFIVERSADGLSWQAIHNTPGKGYSSTQSDYMITDEEPLLGTSYYRLAQVSTQGGSTYSHTVHVDLTSKSGKGILLFPNPANDRLSIYMADRTMPVELRIHNELGQVMGKPVILNSMLQDIDITMLVPGVYVAVLTGDGPPKMEKLIVHR